MYTFAWNPWKTDTNDTRECTGWVRDETMDTAWSISIRRQPRRNETRIAFQDEMFDPDGENRNIKVLKGMEHGKARASDDEIRDEAVAILKAMLKLRIEKHQKSLGALP